MFKSPKTRFLEEQGDISRHQALVVSDWFLHSLDMAMLELVHNLSSNGVNDAAAAGLRIEGAREYRRILENLGESPKLQTLTYTLPAQLNPNA